MPNATFRRFIGVARELGSTTLQGAVSAAGTSLTLVDPTGFSSTSKVTIYDGDNTEIVTASALAGDVLTVGALAHDHGNGCLVTTVGTASAGPTAYIPVNKFDPKDNLNKMPDDGWRGSEVDNYGVILGSRSADLSIGGPAFPDSIGYLIAAVLGDVTFTGGTPNQHKLSVKNAGDGQGVNYQLTDVYLPNVGAGVARQYGGVQGSDITLNFNAADSLLSFDFTGNAYASGKVAVPTASFSAVRPLASWTGVIKVNGVVSPMISDGSIEIKRPVNPIPIIGQQDPLRLFGGRYGATGKATVVALDETWLEYYINNTQLALDFMFSTGSGASQVAINPHFSSARLTNSPPDASKDWLTYGVEWQAEGNTTDAGTSGGYAPGSVTLFNSLATGTFG